MRRARTRFDLETYVERVRSGPCFVCALVEGKPGYSHHVVHEDDEVIAFLARYPTLMGQCLVAPKRHVESLVDDLDEAAYLRLQRVVHRVSRAVVASVPTERV
jgi:histidine triad (HIT) family protein/ATP adenylyltransferase